jgi:two-component system cell cycle sensor histidine kinase/response regulator CckA
VPEVSTLRNLVRFLKQPPQSLRGYGLSLGALFGATVLATISRRLIGPKGTVLVSLMGNLVVLLAAWIGYGPGILTCVLITFVIPRLFAAGQVNVNWSRFGVLLFISLLVSRVSASKRRSEAILRQSAEDLEGRVRERTRALEESETRYRLLFENNPQPMWVYDQQTLQFLTVNDTAIEHYGYSREEFLVMTLRDIRPEEELPNLLEAVSTPLTGFKKAGTFRHRKKNGQIISVEITEDPITFEGRAASLVLATDVTDRLRLEEHLRQSQRLESIGLLAGGVAHDFNNLLTIINGYADMLLHDVPAESALSDGIGEIQQAGNRAADLTKQLLAFSRRQLIQPTVLNLNLVIVDVQKMLRRLIGEDIEIVINLAEDLGNVHADPGQMQQIIVNLAVNARDAMPSGGTLYIETANIDIDAPISPVQADAGVGPHVVLTITDNGTGMTPEVKQRAFEPFFTTKAPGAGTGLGLATVYGMVKQSGGWISLYSEIGIGSSFRIFLPRTTDAEVQQTPVVAKSGLEGNETVLVVEDQNEVRSFAVTALRRYGYNVLCAEAGAEALQIAAEHPGRIHLLITDIVMPGMTGVELAQRLPILKPGIKVIFMSGYSERASTSHTKLDPTTPYLDKPFTASLLAEKVRDVLGPRDITATVLLVEDDDSVRRFMRKVLTDARFAVVETSNGRQAVDCVSRTRCDLVITDLAMPDQEGIETIQQLRKRHPELKIIAISGMDSVMLSVATKLGACRSLSKPIGSDQLLQVVTEVLN